MQIASIQKTTLIDYPGEIASTIFLRGCNYNCTFCYNKSLISHKGQPEDMSAEECFRLLVSRVDKIQHVVITGGEPTCSDKDELFLFLKLLKSYGFKIKFDTNGSNPEALRSLIVCGLVDYVAMDVKSSPSRYYDVVGTFGQGESIKSSMEELKASGIDYEFRTTIFKEFFDIGHFEEIFTFIAPYVKNYYLQNFYSTPGGIDFTGFRKEEISEVINLASNFGIKVKLRGKFL